MSEGRTTRDHETIRKWAEARGGQPAAVEQTRSGGDPGILRLDFEPKDSGLSTISWEEFFRKFDAADLSFLYQDETDDGHRSRFHKFVHEGRKH